MSVKIKKSEYQDYADCIRSDQVSAAGIVDLFKDKVIQTFIHGFLHLLGFDHVRLKDYKRMLKEEKIIYKSVINKIS